MSATPEDWLNLDLLLGLGANLLPQVADPAAPISPKSALTHPHAAPSRYEDGLVVGIAGWETLTVTRAMLERWSSDGRYNILLRHEGTWTLVAGTLDGERVDLSESEFVKGIVDGAHSRPEENGLVDPGAADVAEADLGAVPEDLRPVAGPLFLSGECAVANGQANLENVSALAYPVPDQDLPVNFPIAESQETAVLSVGGVPSASEAPPTAGGTESPSTSGLDREENEMKRPSFQFYPQDWLGDMALQSCSYAAIGLWIQMLCKMHDGKPYGYLKFGEVVIRRDNLSLIFKGAPKSLASLYDELEKKGVLRLDSTGCIYSKRMTEDEKKRGKQSSNGSKGGSPILKEWARQKAMNGNGLVNHEDKKEVIQHVKDALKSRLS